MGRSRKTETKRGVSWHPTMILPWTRGMSLLVGKRRKRCWWEMRARTLSVGALLFDAGSLFHGAGWCWSVGLRSSESLCGASAQPQHRSTDDCLLQYWCSSVPGPLFSWVPNPTSQEPPASNWIRLQGVNAGPGGAPRTAASWKLVGICSECQWLCHTKLLNMFNISPVLLAICATETTNHFLWPDGSVGPNR